jgi:hypothetical protein
MGCGTSFTAFILEHHPGVRSTVHNVQLSRAHQPACDSVRTRSRSNARSSRSCWVVVNNRSDTDQPGRGLSPVRCAEPTHVLWPWTSKFAGCTPVRATELVRRVLTSLTPGMIPTGTFPASGIRGNGQEPSGAIADGCTPTASAWSCVPSIDAGLAFACTLVGAFGTPAARHTSGRHAPARRGR